MPRVAIILIAAAFLSACDWTLHSSNGGSMSTSTMTYPPLPFEAVTIDGKTTVTCKSSSSSRCYGVSFTSECKNSVGAGEKPKTSCEYQVVEQYTLNSGESKSFPLPPANHYHHCASLTGPPEIPFCAK